MADTGHVVNLGALHQGVLDLHGEDVLSPAGDHVLLSVHNVEKPLLVDPQQVPRVKPAVLEGIRGHFRILEVSLHHSVGGKNQFSHLSRRNFLAFRVHQLALDPKGRFADGSGFAEHILGVEVEEPAAPSLGNSIDIGNTARKSLHQPFHHLEGHGLGPDLQVFPRREVIVGKLDPAALQRVEHGHCNGNHEKDIRPLFLRHSFEDPLGVGELPQKGPRGAGGIERGPEEHGPAVIEGKEKDVVVVLLHKIAHPVADGRIVDGIVGVQHGLGLARGSGCEHHGKIVPVIHIHQGFGRVGVPGNRLVVDHVRRDAVSDADAGLDGLQVLLHRLGYGEELRAQDKHTGVADLGGIENVRPGKAEIQGNHDRSQLDNPEVGDEPLQAVVLEMHHKIPVLNPHLLGKVVGRFVDFIVELSPGHGPPAALGRRPFDKTGFIGQVPGVNHGVFGVVHGSQPPRADFKNSILQKQGPSPGTT